jgi:hypothetical protein
VQIGLLLKAYRQGYWAAIDRCILEVESVDPDGMKPKGVRLAIFHRLMRLRPPSWTQL